MERNDFALFSDSSSRFLIEVAEADSEEFEALMKGKGCAKIGKVTEKESLLIHGLDGKVAVDVSLGWDAAVLEKNIETENPKM